ncbi:unnamed protein product [Mycena citricolor]|uniref:Ubiquitin thioesterase OTU n=1 Tax=Mycena citricolor TaxID=2018698 RepID=A0AAD2GZC1_9AGAR|nr:unnamed protein product [Mycena citricolor]
MAPLRVRHPKGVSTIQVPLDRDDFTVQGRSQVSDPNPCSPPNTRALARSTDLQQEILKVSDILPSRQLVKGGYPPRTLTLIPELPVTSLGLASGEQLIVSEDAGSGPASVPSRPTTSPFLNPTTTNPSSAVPPPPAVRRPSAPKAAASDAPDAVETDGSYLVHRVVPDDNSCLFSSVALVFEQDIKKAPKLREVVANGIRNDPMTYSEAILGMPPDRYIAKILQPNTWGGAIELAILASHYGTEIASIDVETGRIDHFTPSGNEHPENRCLVIYSGIHYDAASLAPMVDAPSDWHQTVFPARNADIMDAAKKLAKILKDKHKYTNTATFDLKCLICDKGLKGEKGAQAHASETGHTRFGEYQA